MLDVLFCFDEVDRVEYDDDDAADDVVAWFVTKLNARVVAVEWVFDDVVGFWWWWCWWEFD
jgi:hypothetical protein